MIRETVLRKSSSELTGSGTSIPGSVSFCSSGKSIAIGSNEGDLLVLDIATSEVMSAYRHPSKTPRGAIVQVKWIQYVDQHSNYHSECQLNGRLHTWRQGGINLVDR